MFYERQGYRF
ncbi:hypothetical protein HU200_027049 [Digitaria exilis]|uniref:Uncharacterized protein n=1 Tax=Digitaria exilis TaxID=1010633 RepID=A0A835C819_9POAL|nr:hypothetical protein HU200_027049 [Digitaria exilis]